MKALAAICAGFMLSASALSYLVPSLAYEDMFAKSDLVVIARPIRSHDTGERKMDRDVNPPVPVADVITDCQAMFVLKGPKLKQFKFHHYRDVSRRDPKVLVMGGPTGITFDIPKNKRYLMFLVREAGGQFAPL